MILFLFIPFRLVSCFWFWPPLSLPFNFVQMSLTLFSWRTFLQQKLALRSNSQCKLLLTLRKTTDTPERVVLFFRIECSKRLFVSHFFKAIPVSGFCGLFRWMELICTNGKRDLGRNLPVLIFVYHLPKPWTNRFAHVNSRTQFFPAFPFSSLS